jgi:hypothetical protein
LIKDRLRSPVIIRTLQGAALLFALCLAMPMLFAAPASAQSLECKNLRKQIAGAANTAATGRGGAQAAKYAEAIASQKGQIRKARAQMRSMSCQSSRSASCTRVTRALNSMQANLSKLEAQHKRLKRGGGATSGRSALLARFKAAGCTTDGSNGDLPGVTVARAGKGLTDGIAALFGVSPKREGTGENGEFSRERIPGLDFAGDTFRTLCVRTCDGYYFPISFSTIKSNFRRDLGACQAMCPGTEVRLFFHEVPEQESEDMISTEGEPYKAMTYAFAYRRDGISSDPSCKCAPVLGGYAVLNPNSANGPAAPAETKPADPLAASNAVPVPMPRADALAPAGLNMRLAGRMSEDDIVNMLRRQELPQDYAAGVRMIGPAFLPDQEGGIMLKKSAEPVTR